VQNERAVEKEVQIQTVSAEADAVAKTKADKQARKPTRAKTEPENTEAGEPNEPPVDEPKEGGPATVEGEEDIEPIDTFEDVPVEPVATLLEEVRQFMLQYVVLPDVWASIVVTLWVAHTWLIEHCETTPRLVIQSPTKRSGKTRLLEVLQATTKGGMQMTHSSVAALVRLIDRGEVTVLLDEVDQIVGARGGMAAEMLSIINSGYRSGATVARCTGDSSNIKVQILNAFGPVALAGIDNFPWPDTILDRSIILRLERRRDGDTIEAWQHSNIAEQVRLLQRRLGAMAYRHGDRLSNSPTLPPEIKDRDADIWEPLIAIAELAGEHWPEWATTAALQHVYRKSEHDDDSMSLSERLLADIKKVFDRGTSERLPSSDLLIELCADQEAPWGSLRGQRLDARGLAFRLRRFGVRPKDIRIGTSVVKGYVKADFEQSWELYVSDTTATNAPILRAPTIPAVLPPAPARWSATAAKRYLGAFPTAPREPTEPQTVAGVEIPADATQQWARWLLRDAGINKLATEEEEHIAALPSGPPVCLGVVLDENATEADIHAALEARNLTVSTMNVEDFKAKEARFPTEPNEAETDF